MGDPTPDRPSTPSAPQEQLDSWKEIAGYLSRDVKTVQRWEKQEAMPVHRHVHGKMGSVYAFSSELDAWLQSRKLHLEEEEGQKEQQSESPVRAEGHRDPAQTPRGRRWFVLGGVTVVALLAIIYVVVRGRPRDTTPLRIKSLAVLPLKNLSGDSGQEYFADGMTEELIGRLSMIHGLRVISRTSAMHYKDTQLSVPEIARVLHVDAVVEGSVVREGARVRIHAQLISAQTDEHFWSETYDREMRDVLAMQSDVAQAIAAKVEVTVTGEERARIVAARPVAPEVYELYLKGEFQQGNGKVEIQQSIAYFEEAIRRDPTFAPAYVGLAEAYGSLSSIFVGGSPGETRPRVISAARKALELDAENAEAHALLGDMEQVEWHWGEAEAEYQRALQLKPNDVEAHQGFANWLLCQGRTDEALAWARRARELDPLGVTGTQIGWILFQERRYDEAIQELRSALAVHPDYANVQWTLGFALIGGGRSEEAIPLLEKTATIMHRSPGSIELLATAHARAGHRAEALRLINELKRQREATYIPAGALINPHLALGDYDEAFVWFERAYQERSNILQFLKVHPFFDPVRNDPRFKDLLHRVGLDKSY
jgi:TolB-like protein/Tfp pilus assembly protein PilF